MKALGLSEAVEITPLVQPLTLTLESGLYHD